MGFRVNEVNSLTHPRIVRRNKGKEREEINAHIRVMNGNWKMLEIFQYKDV